MEAMLFRPRRVQAQMRPLIANFALFKANPAT